MLILVGLGVLWALVLLPPAIRHSTRAASPRPISGLSAVNRLDANGLRVIQRAATTVPNDAGSARRRRRDVLLTLVGLAVFTFLAGVAVGGVLWTLHFFVDLALVGYAVLLTNRHQRLAEQGDTVVPLRSSTAFPTGTTAGPGVGMQDEAVLRRRAN